MEGTSKNIKVQIIEMLFGVPDEDANEILVDAITEVQERRKKNIAHHSREKAENENRFAQLNNFMRAENKAVKMSEKSYEGEASPGSMASRESYDKA